MGDFRVIADHQRQIVRRCTTLYDVVRRRSHRGPISRCLGSFWSCSKTCCDYRSCGISKDDRAMSYDVKYDIVRRRDSLHDICAIDVRWRHMTSYMIVRRRRTQSRIVRHRMTVIRSSYDHRATLIYKTLLASHHTLTVKSYVIVRLSFDYRSTVARCHTIYLCFGFSPSNHSEVVCHRTTIVRLSYYVVRCSTCCTISHKLSMCRKPIVSGVTTKLRLQYRSRIGEHFRNLRCHPLHDVAARCDQGFNLIAHY